jgi:hypothetical protein
MVLDVLLRIEDEDVIGAMVAKSKLSIVTKTWMLAKLGRWDDLEREVREFKALDQSDLWKLAKISTSREDVCTMLVMRALTCKDLLMSQERIGLVKIAFQNLGQDGLKDLEEINLVALRIDLQIAQELAPRFPEGSMRLLKGCVADMDPQRLTDLMFILKDRRSAYDLGETWLKRKLTVSPRYDRIRAVLMAMRCRLNDDDWHRLNDSLSKEFPGRMALKCALADVERMKRPAGNAVPMVWDAVEK